MHLSSYRWIVILVTAIACQLGLARIADALPEHNLSHPDFTKVDHTILAAAPQNPLPTVEGKGSHPLKGSSGSNKAFAILSERIELAVDEPRKSVRHNNFYFDSYQPLWLLHQSLLL